MGNKLLKGKSDISSIKFNISEDKLEGIYSNVARISNSLHDFTIDFGVFIPEKETFEVLTRIKLSPNHAKVFLQAFKENVANYERKFGTINVPGVAQKDAEDGGAEKKEDLTYIG
ncbi:MAG: hypothetical protein SCAL_000946 [Candidatus Syntrophoarchaeum caldarius]|uniref:DUF3467 domain-containing protein n=1 Tax=Candidatus Syntropharchaeum caldarium TaxID=1838285 RepID=A0A1F2PCE5_9EURY|nr:MAG: hypothetical protein SCAL_000946 [Candidatus Syntrophoarchaeum caldarius]